MQEKPIDYLLRFGKQLPMGFRDMQSSRHRGRDCTRIVGSFLILSLSTILV